MEMFECRVAEILTRS